MARVLVPGEGGGGGAAGAERAFTNLAGMALLSESVSTGASYEAACYLSGHWPLRDGQTRFLYQSLDFLSFSF